MGVGNKSYPITDVDSLFLAAGNREEVMLMNYGPNVVWLAFNEPAEAELGIYLKVDFSIILNKLKCDAAIHAICASGETAALKAQITL